MLHLKLFHDALTLYKTSDVFKIRNSHLVLPSQLGDKRNIVQWYMVQCDLYAFCPDITELNSTASGIVIQIYST